MQLSRKATTKLLTLRAQLAPLSVIASMLYTHLAYAAKYVVRAEGKETCRRSLLDGDVYFMQVFHPDPGPIKVGWSGFPELRLETLQTGSPFELRLLASYRASYKEEVVVHNKLLSSRLRGEWYLPSEEVLAEVAKHTSRGTPAAAHRSTLAPEVRKVPGWMRKVFVR